MNFDFENFDEAYNADVKKKINEKEKRRTRTQRRRNAWQSVLMAILVVLLVGVLINIIRGYIEIDQMKYHNNILAHKVTTLNEEIVEIRNQIEEKTQSGLVEEIATQKLGLAHPKASQIVRLEMGQKYALKDGPRNDTIKSEVASTTANQ